MTTQTTTQTTPTPAEALADKLRGHIGTANYYYLPRLGRNSLHYTDGIRALCTKAEAFWLLDQLNATLYDNTQFAAGFWLVRITIHDYKGKIEIAYDSTDAGTLINTDGERGKADHTTTLDFTDFPEGTFEFFIVNKIAMLKSEY